MSTEPLPIFYDASLSTQGFPNPLLKARIAGQEAIFIVDSGASAHVLAEWFIQAAGITATRSSSTATGPDGNETAKRLARRIRGEWSDGQAFSLNEAAVIAFPPLFTSLHLGGLISPQLLAPAGTAAVLDLRKPSLQFEPFARALRELHDSTVPSDRIEICRNAAAELANRVYLAPVTAAGVTELMLLDTGSTATILADDSRITRDIEKDSEPGPSSRGVSGDLNARRMVRNVQLLRGGRTIAVNPSIGKVTGMCDAKGILGMDALRSCVLILGDNEMALSCD